MDIQVFYKLSNIFLKSEYKQDAKNLYQELVKLEYAILTAFWEEVLESFNKPSKKL